MKFFIFLSMQLIMAFFISITPIFAGEPWIITSPVYISEPVDVEGVVVLDGGALIVSDVPEPGFRLSGDLYVLGGGSVEFRNSVIELLSTYPGQYNMTALEQGTLTMTNCNYRVPSDVSTAIIAWGGRVDLQDSIFKDIQLVAAGQGTMTATRLNGTFECILMDEAHMELVDIPLTQDAGSLWVWPTFMPGSRAVYSPPMPGFVSSYSFPPVGSSGINQSFQITRCNVSFWPMLVREASDLTISDVAEEKRVVIGLLLPTSTIITGLFNGRTYVDETLSLTDRKLHLKNALVNSWNLYPMEIAQVTVRDSVIGELLADGDASVVMENTTVDGTGGYFGALGRAAVEANTCTFTCNIWAAGEASIVLRNSLVLPYPSDTTGEFTLFGAFNKASLHVDRTFVSSTPYLYDQGAIVVTWLTNLPNLPPSKPSVAPLSGIATVFSLDTSMDLTSWELKAYNNDDSSSVLIGSGSTNVWEEFLGNWENANPAANYELLLTIKDKAGRTFTGRTPVP